MDELTQYSAAKLASLISARVVSPVEVMEAHLSKIDGLNPALNAIVTMAPDAIDRAREAEAAVIRGFEIGTLHGVPFTVKDTIETKGLKTTSGSLIRRTHVPNADAPAVARLKASGAILLGKTNVPEMAIPYECDNPVFGRTNNPYDLSLTSGGSSGGEAAAISACLAPAGLGSDLSGSIRVPAHFCGITGLKPTPGRIAAEGHFPSVTGPLAEGAVIGPMARNIVDLMLLLDVLTESTAETRLSPQPHAQRRLHGCRVAAYVEETVAPITEETKAAIRAALHALSLAGLVVIDEQPPGIEQAASLWMRLFADASARQLREVYSGHVDLAGPQVRSIVKSLESTSSEELSAAWVERDSLRTSLIRWMHTTPLIIAPVGSVPAFEHGARRVEVGGQSISVFRAFGASRAFNVLGLPAVAVPAGRARNGLPIGVQVIGRPFQEEAVLLAASIIEESLGGWVAPPNAVQG